MIFVSEPLKFTMWFCLIVPSKNSISIPSFFESLPIHQSMLLFPSKRNRLRRGRQILLSPRMFFAHASVGKEGKKEVTQLLFVFQTHFLKWENFSKVNKTLTITTVSKRSIQHLLRSFLIFNQLFELIFSKY